MPVIANCDATDGLSSVLSFAKIAFGDALKDACSNAGAIMRQGPHHGAQKSTRMGMSVLLTNREKDESVNSTEEAGSNNVLHFPQTGLSPSRSGGTRLSAPQ